MPTYSVTGINVGTFNLGESDKRLTIFTAEKGLIFAVAKGARKPGAKIAGRSDLLIVNRYLIARGKSLDIITQAEGLDMLPDLRKDLLRLAYGFYYADLTQHFGKGLDDDCQDYFELLWQSLRAQAESCEDPVWLCLKFELALLDMLGLRPETTLCAACQIVLDDNNIAVFHHAEGGVVCRDCQRNNERQIRGAHQLPAEHTRDFFLPKAPQITPNVWKHLVLAQPTSTTAGSMRYNLQSLEAAHRLIQGYIEHKAGRRLKSLDLLEELSAKYSRA